MADTPSPVTFRLTPEEKDLMEAVARYRGETVSEFIRSAVLNGARRLIADVGAEDVLQANRDYEERKRVAETARAAELLGAVQQLIPQTEQNGPDNLGSED